MTETNLATSLGGSVGLNTSAGVNTGANAQALSTPETERPVRLNPDHPFGVTAIIGGTNVRFVVSVPDQDKPLITSVKWQELNDMVAPQLASLKRDFSTAKDLVFPLLAKQLVDFVASKFEPCPSGPPFEKLCALNFSIAGLVAGSGRDARISTTNTGLVFREEQIALSLLAAINQELMARHWKEVSIDKVAVMNDAAAGLLGERLAGGLKDCQDGLFIILGTGVGSMGLVDGNLSLDFDELGHRITWDAHRKRYVFHNTEQFRTLLDETGSFKPLPTHQHYAENELAGPWAAIKFVKLLSDQYNGAFFSLADLISKKLGRSPELVEQQLEKVIDLKSTERTQWAVNSPSDIVRSVNDVLFNPNAADLFAAFPCDLNLDELMKRNSEEALTVLAAIRWKVYFKRVGEFIGAAYNAMEATGRPPEKIVLAGGIGELCSRYNKLYKDVALKIIHEAAEIPGKTVVFSEMSPEAREAAVTTDNVQRTFEKVQEDVPVPSVDSLLH